MSWQRTQHENVWLRSHTISKSAFNGGYFKRHQTKPTSVDTSRFHQSDVLIIPTNSSALILTARWLQATRTNPTGGGDQIDDDENC